MGGEAGVRYTLDFALAARIRELDRDCDLTLGQERKLRLAGRGETRRLFDRIGEARRRLVLAGDDANQIRAVLKEAAPLRAALDSDPFGEGSPFGKALKTTLDGTQVAKYEMVLREEAWPRYREMVDILVARANPGLELSEGKRRRFAELLRDDLRSPRPAGRPSFDDAMARAASLPDAKLKAIFDGQWPEFQQRLEEVRARGRDGGAGGTGRP